ncbi:hypothetical protein [Pseudomonas aeruginosa]|uniref:hypothetical protein n=1 Tax=Pseudomonas aeruginosa TaxID=287 RepID=UPI002D784C49|nr:hypothetical protein [Pseudomonas aeruginosa]WRS36152.1 hypothetical protein U9S62_08910 [Pseudomonas aeruginosa]WRS37218.1 hypothetical protein U9S62_14460 [Pseudomonas aeruginosa]
MSEVKKISPVGNIYGWEEGQFGEFVLSEDYDALAAEAQALREEVAALRARVVVVPNRLPRSSDIASIHQHSIGWNACLDELARLNDMTVSEGLLRRLCEPLLSHADYLVARNELRALLSEQE